MAWIRAWQYSAETQSMADLQLFGGGATAPTISATAPYTGTYSYRGGIGLEPFGRTFAAGVAAVRAGAFIRHNGVDTNDLVHVFSLAIGSTYIAVQWDKSTDTFRLRAGFVSGSSTERYPVADESVGSFATINTWYHVGIVAYLHDTAGFVTFYVDGAAVLTWTGDTRIYNTGSATPQTAITGCYVAGSLGGTDFWTQYVYVDDFYIDTNDSAPGDYPPTSRRFLAAFPTADTATAEWTPNTGSDHYAMINEAPPDDDTTRLKADGPGLTDLFDFATITLPSQEWAVRAVIPVAYARKTDANFDCTLRLAAALDGDTDTSDAQELGVGYGFEWARFAQTPQAEAWTETRVNAAQFGIQSDGTFLEYG